MATILLTGATGTVGSILAPLLNEKGHKIIYLTRAKNGQEAQERVLAGNVVWQGDVTLSNCGVSISQRNQWKGKIDKIINCAASIKFKESLSDEINRVNVGGVKNLLHLAEELGIKEFHQVSTAYVAGDSSYFTEDDKVPYICGPCFFPEEIAIIKTIYYRTEEEALSELRLALRSIKRIVVAISTASILVKS